MMIAVELPLRIQSEANTRGAWQARFFGRTKPQRSATVLMLRPKLGKRISFPVRVTLTRIAPRALDDDNLRTALKSVRDGVADALGLKNDRDPRVAWDYQQHRRAPNEYAVSIVIVNAEVSQ